MSYAFVNQVEDSKNGTAFASIDAPNFTPPAGALMILGIWIDGNFGSFNPTIDDITGSNDVWTRINACDLNGGIGTWRWFYLANAAADSTTIRVTFGSNKDFPAVFIAWYSGLTATPFGASTDAFTQIQLSPGTGTDALSSDNTSTLSGQPALQFGFIYQTTGLHTPTAGTGFNSRTGVWNFAGSQAISARPEDKRLTATTAVAATGTSSDAAANYMNMTAVFQESVVAASGNKRLTLMGVR